MLLNSLEGWRKVRRFVYHRQIGHKDKWIIDSGCSQHISSNKIFSSYTSDQGERSSLKILLRARWLAKKQSSFVLIIDASLLFKAFVIFPNQGTISSFLEPYMKKGSISVLKVILWKFSKMPKWSFRLNVLAIFICYEIRRLQLVHCNYPRFKIGGCGTIGDYDGFELRCLVLPRRHMGLGGPDTKQENQDHYSCIRANSHKFCVDQKIIGWLSSGWAWTCSI